jgi:uncharacterized membrane protein YeaQ/YmgE (transglycosylase-associated protein family)
MVNYVAAVVIGVVLGAIGGVILRRRQPTALWLAPLLAVVGALVAAILGATLGHAGYGWKKATLQVVLAIVGVAAAAILARRSTTGQPASKTE